MGNVKSQEGGHETRLKTWGVAAYMKWNQEQCLELRDYCLEYCCNKTSNNKSNSKMIGTTTSKTTTCHHQQSSRCLLLSKRVLKLGMKSVGISKDSVDYDILLNLFTLWDVQGDGKVHCLPFLVGASPLACHPKQGFRSVFRFVLKVHDWQHTNQIYGQDLLMVLQSLNCTIAFLGDKCIKNQRLAILVDEMITTISRITATATTTNGDGDNNRVSQTLLAHEDVVCILAVEPIIKQLLQQPWQTTTESSFLTGDDFEIYHVQNFMGDTYHYDYDYHKQGYREEAAAKSQDTHEEAAVQREAIKNSDDNSSYLRDLSGKKPIPRNPRSILALKSRRR